jgi:hypothetical protein
MMIPRPGTTPVQGHVEKGCTPVPSSHATWIHARNRAPKPEPVKVLRKWHCDICGRDFAYAIALAGHKRSHK